MAQSSFLVLCIRNHFGNIFPLDSHISELTTQGTVALAIPLLLFSSEIKTWARLAGKTLISFIIWVVAVGAMAFVAAWVWKGTFDLPNEMGAMAATVYTGGTANMSAVQYAIGAPSGLFDTMNLSDLSFSGMYLIFMLTIAQRLFLKFLPPFPKQGIQEDEQKVKDVPAVATFSQKLTSISLSISLSLIIVGICIGSSILIFGRMEETFIVIFLAVGALLASLYPPIQKLPMSFDIGEYLLLIFCVAVGSRVDLQEVLLAVPTTLAFMGTVALGTVAIHSLFAYLFKIDADTVLITHSAGIFGPPFIGPIASSMKNKEIVVSGMTLGVINLAIGNFMGILIFNLLS